MSQNPRPGGRGAGGRRTGDDDAATRALKAKLAGILNRLPDVERQVIELRMGLVDGTPAKPGQVAERLGLTINEVKRIEERAFSRIREVMPTKGLERFLSR
jgi:DNA-directed RNA polymerase sigma subunit (sigma70/sigma32)